MSRRPASTAAAVSLFPFLAVLLCTMGALVIVLVVLARQSRQSVAESPAPDHRAAEMEIARQDLEWLIAQLDASLAATQKQVREQRIEAGSHEQIARKLRAELAGLERSLARLQDDAGAKKSAEESLVNAMALARRKLQDIESKIQREASREPPKRSYAVVPHVGPNGTRRRPIFIECREDAIVLQPEGIRLSSQDFLGELGPGNPLALAVRAASDRLRTDSDGPDEGEPYPLLLVRPDGIAAYYVARAAIESWGDEFGYELIDEDWNLKYPPADPAVAESMRLAVMEGRRNLAARVRGGRRGGPRRSYRAGPAGGIWAEEDDAHASSIDDPVARWAAGENGAAGGMLADQGTLAAEDRRPLGYRDIGGGLAMNDAGTENEGLDTDPAALAATYGKLKDSRGRAGKPGGRQGAAREKGGGSNAQGASTGDASGDPESAATQQGLVDGKRGAPSASDSDRDSPVEKSRNGTANGQRADQSPRRKNEIDGQRTKSAKSAKGASNRQPSVSISAPPNAQASPGAGQPPGSEHQSMAASRGEEWGLPERPHQALPLLRPIVVECHAEYLQLQPDANGSQGRAVVEWDGDAVNVMDQLVERVWRRIESWGAPGASAYWKPLLEVEVADGGEGRFAELQSLLADSGLEVTRRPPRRVVRYPRTATPE